MQEISINMNEKSPKSDIRCDFANILRSIYFKAYFIWEEKLTQWHQCVCRTCVFSFVTQDITVDGWTLTLTCNRVGQIDIFFDYVMYSLHWNQRIFAKLIWETIPADVIDTAKYLKLHSFYMLIFFRCQKFGTFFF